MSDYGSSPFANPLPGGPPDPSPNPFPDPFGAPASWAAPAAAPPPPARSNALYELRPLSLGEILDRTFTIYRKRFWLYAGISSIAAIVPTLSTLAQFFFVLPARRPDQVNRTLALTLIIALVTGLIGLVAYSFTQAATVSAVSAAYIGDETSIGMALRVARKHWFRYILITLWLGWSAVWLFLVLYVPAIALAFVPSLRLLFIPLILLAVASLVYGLIAYLRNSLGVVASTVEDLKVRAAMRRSKVLVAGHKGRVFAILLLAFVLQIVASVVQGICGALMGASHGPVRVALEALTLVLTFVSTAMVVPVAAIALCLFYIDERVRKEGFDVEILMLRGAPAPAPPPTPEAIPSPFSSELA
jgi:hypothetical protein